MGVSAQEQLQASEHITFSAEALAFLETIDKGEADGVSCWRSSDVERREGSRIHGQGLFAVNDILAGTLIAIKQGHEVDVDTIRDQADIIKGSQQQIGPRTFLTGLTEGEVDKNLVGYNHSCDPNARVGVAKGMPLGFLMTRKPIKAGEEITTDYSVSQKTTTHIIDMICECGADNCRRIILPAWDWQDEALQQKYAGEFVWFIQEAIDRRRQLSPEDLEAQDKSTEVLKTLCTVGLINDRRLRLQALKQRIAADSLPARLIEKAYFLRKGLENDLQEYNQALLDLATNLVAIYPFGDFDELSERGQLIGKDLTADEVIDFIKPRVAVNFDTIIQMICARDKALNS